MYSQHQPLQRQDFEDTAVVHRSAAHSIAMQAEHELAAFLQASSSVLGLTETQHASELWLRTLETQPWPTGNYEKFFRAVTVRTIAECVRSSSAELSAAR